MNFWFGMPVACDGVWFFWLVDIGLSKAIFYVDAFCWSFLGIPLTSLYFSRILDALSIGGMLLMIVVRFMLLAVLGLMVLLCLTGVAVERPGSISKTRLRASSSLWNAYVNIFLSLLIFIWIAILTRSALVFNFQLCYPFKFCSFIFSCLIYFILSRWLTTPIFYESFRPKKYYGTSSFCLNLIIPLLDWCKIGTTLVGYWMGLTLINSLLYSDLPNF